MIKKLSTKKRPKKEINPLFTTDDWLTHDECEQEGHKPVVDSEGILKEIFESIDSKYDENMIVLRHSKYFAMVAKTVSKSVLQKSEKSIFQPHETTENVVLCILTLLDFTPYGFNDDYSCTDDYEFRSLSLIGCPVIRITRVEDVARILETI